MTSLIAFGNKLGSNIQVWKRFSQTYRLKFCKSKSHSQEYHALHWVLHISLSNVQRNIWSWVTADVCYKSWAGVSTMQYLMLNQKWVKLDCFRYIRSDGKYRSWRVSIITKGPVTIYRAAGPYCVWGNVDVALEPFCVIILIMSLCDKYKLLIAYIKILNMHRNIYHFTPMLLRINTSNSNVTAVTFLLLLLSQANSFRKNAVWIVMKVKKTTDLSNCFRLLPLSSSHIQCWILCMFL